MRQAMTVWLAVCALATTAWAQGGPDVLEAEMAVRERAVVVTVELDAGWHVNAHRPRQDYLIPTALTIAPPPGARVGEVAYPAPVDRQLEFSDEPLLLYEGTFELTAPLEDAADGTYRASLRYQACDDTTCLPPRTLELVATRGGGAAVAPHSPDQIASLVEHYGLGLTFLFVGIVGLGLNLTPCVYPMISVTIAFFGGRGSEGRARTVSHALLYVVGICLSFSVMGVMAAVTGSLFGAALQQPAVLGGISLLMVGLALSNFGVYQFRMPAALTQMAGRASDGALGAVFMGLTMGIVGAPCIGPIVAALLLYVGAEQSPLLGFGLFFALGLGMGLPYVALALAAGRLRRLPRGGMWLGWVEWLFGFLLLGLALYFATPLLPDTVVRVGWALLVAVAAIVLGIVRPVGGPAVRWGLRLTGLLLAAYSVSTLVEAEAAPPIDWAPFSEARLVSAREAGRPVLIDFEATWCLPCRKMDRTTFRDDRVVSVTESWVMLKADVTEQDDQAEALMKRFQVPGVPTYLLLGADGSERRRFVGYVEAEAMATAMRETAGPAERG
jgi:thiol:disulfide interchange protein DsbD